MGLLDLIGSTGMGSALNTLGSVVTWPLANYSNNRQNNMNRENMELGWKYQRDLQQQSSELQYENWLKEFNAQNAYNSPSAEVARMMAAGINPYVSNSGAAVGGGSSSMPAAASAPGSSSPGVPSAPSLTGSFSEFSQGIKDITQAIGQNIHNSKAKELLDAELDKLLKDNANKDLENVIRGIEIDFLPKLKDAELRNILKDTDLKVAQIFNTNSNTALTEARFDVEKARNVLMEKEGRLKEGQISELNIYLNKLDTLLQSQIDKNRASAAESYGSAEYSRASAKTINALREGQVTAQSFENTILRLQMIRDVSTQQDQIHAIVERANRESLISSELEEKIKSLEKENDWKEVQIILGCLGQAVGMYTSLGNMATQELGALTKIQRNEIQSEFNRLYQERTNSETFEDRQFFRPDGSFGGATQTYRTRK